MSKLKLKPLAEQTIVITGASSGIGLATARMAAQRGANVVLSSRHGPALDEAASAIRIEGGNAISVIADVTKYDDVISLRDQALEEYGTIDTWINNAGTSIFGYLLEVPLEEERQLFEVNFWGVRHGCHVAVPVLAQNGGVLINMGSEVSGRAIPLQGMYSATKHAVKAYTDALRMELEKKEIPVAVSLIRPAGIDTPFAEHARNELEIGEPSLPGTVFHPNIVAEAVLKCAVSPQRDVYIGASARIATLLDAFFPRLTDLYMEKNLFDQQMQGASIPHIEENEILMHPPTDEGRVRGVHEGHVAKSSLYTDLTV